MGSTADEWSRTREEYLEYLNTIPDGSWNREGRHPTHDPLSLTDGARS